MRGKGLVERAFWTAILLCLLPLSARAADPVVDNVQVAQRRDGSKLADVTCAWPTRSRCATRTTGRWS